MADVFLSYARPNAAVATRIAKALGEAGYSVWYDSDLPAHRTYSDVIASELEGARAVLVLWSADAVESQWVRSEANRARELGKLVQARLGEARPPMPFDQIQCADLTGWRRNRKHPGWANVISSVGALVGGDHSKRTPIAAAGRSSWGRRELIAGGAAATLAAGGAGWWLLRKEPTSKISPETAALLTQAKGALWQNTPEGQNQAVGILRQVTTGDPSLAEGWGRLAMTYALTSHWRAASDAAPLQQRARSAAKQGLSLDPRNAHATAGLAWARPFMGNWLDIVRDLRKALTFDPKDGEANFLLAMNLTMIGRSIEALEHVNPVLNGGPTPGIYVWHAQMLWSAGRDDAMDALLDEATKLYPTHFGVWFTRFYTAMMGGRPAAALALAADTADRPTGIDPAEIDAVVRVAKAVQSRAPAEIDGVTKEWVERAHQGAGLAENAAQFMASLGRVDEAFTVLRAYYFAEGFDPGEVRFERAQGSYTPRNDRQTAFLFNPAMAPARADPRFAKLMSDLRLTDYWRASGNEPDYLASGR